MPSQGPQWTEFLSCEVCCKLFSENANRPISLGCGHTVCKQCLSHLQQSKCPFDQSPINCDIDKLPVNYALLQLIGAAIPDKLVDSSVMGDISDAKKTECYESARKCIEELAVYLKPLSEDSLNELEKNHEDITELKVNKSGQLPQLLHTRGGRTIAAQPSHGAACVLSRPMQRKLLVLINCQLVEEEGRSRAARAARSLGERTVTELILAHQNPQQLSANLWAAVRTRGCQFLGPGMQEEVLRLILLALEDGSALSRKVLVLFVVQRLEKQYPQASKTAIGHVVQLLYRASCFKVTKREEESSLMQLKEEFRTYESLRLEHDAQIVQIAMEAGLRISPEQWSSLLYGDASHKSHMQSIIDKHQNPQSFTQGISELVLVLQRLGDPTNLSRLRPHLEFLAKIDPSPDCPAPSWEDLEAVMKSLKIVVQGLVDFVKRYNHRRLEVTPPQNTRYKTSMCRDFIAKGSCPRGATCTFAHSQEELEQYRSRSKKLSQRGGAMFGHNGKLDGSLSDDGMLLSKDAEKGSENEDEPKVAKANQSIGNNTLAGLVPSLSAMSLNPSVLATTGHPAQPMLATPPGLLPQLPLSMPHSRPEARQAQALHPFPVAASSQPPPPGAVYSLLAQPLTLQAPSAPGLCMPFPPLQDGARPDIVTSMVPQVMLTRGLADLGVPYQGGHNPALAPTMLGTAPPAFLPATAPPPPPPPPPSFSTARPPERQSCLAPGDMVQVGAAGMFPGSVLGSSLPPETLGLSSADLHAATLTGVNMQTVGFCTEFLGSQPQVFGAIAMPLVRNSE